MVELITRWRYAMARRFRRRRFEYLWETIGCRAGAGWWLDLGGGPGSYLLAHLDAAARATARALPRVILLDVSEPELRDAQQRYPGAQLVRADGARLPFLDRAFALVFCNSVIEHVTDPAALAREIRRTSRHFFVQTPNAGFPLESHSRVPLPFYRRLPRPIQQWLCRRIGASYAYLASVNYLSEPDLRRYFPGAVIARERAWGLTKSFYVLGAPE